LFSDKIAPSTYRICRDQFIDKHLDQYLIDLVVVFEDTISILGDDADELKFIGNWANYKTRTKTLKMYYAKKLTSPSKGGFDVTNFQHTLDKIKKYFDKQLIWQRSPNFKLVTTKEQLDELIIRLQEQDSVAVDYESNDFEVLRPDFVVKTIGLFFPNEAYCIAYEVPETPDVQYRKK
jgi:ethanolamine utilization cobalamin adenosyltransferase